MRPSATPARAASSSCRRDFTHGIVDTIALLHGRPVVRRLDGELDEVRYRTVILVGA